MQVCAATTCIWQKERTAGTGVEVCVVLSIRQEFEEWSTFASTFNLPTAKQGIAEEIRQATIEVHRRQTALETLSWSHQFGQITVHAFAKSCDE